MRGELPKNTRTELSEPHSPQRILLINPGSTSTKLAVFEEGREIRNETVRHSSAELAGYSTIWEQFPFRLQTCRRWIGGQADRFSAVVANGGLLRPVEGGVYAINERMLRDARSNLQGEHASNLSSELVFELARERKCCAFIVDPVSVDEFEPLARYSGHPSIQRKSLSHALNIHAAAGWAAGEVHKPLGESSFVIGHLGGGISIAAVRAGRIVDVNDAASDGPFSPERTGGLPLQQFISLCFSGSHSEREIRSLVMGKGGLVSYLVTNSTEEVEQRIHSGDMKAKEIYEAMAYQIAKEIGAMAAVLKGDVDAVVLSGGMSRSAMLTGWIEGRVKHISSVMVHPGDDEMKTLACRVMNVLRGQEQAKEY
ncbi:MAG TPA: butyrate kinase [Bacteroidota bacterium]|nr:butyrate kinase [Bacteroidota bacterium]